ncbi:MAG: efflux RND transporter periplasmic adaptor subunit [Bacteroidetes bacterium]|nr:MAG: efflux RND transporter periplasmic adaptor subunit [Bacteroidota bacterium]MBL1144893.1 efflux RND transporter periplasmic adaptor subunit [Bacteroidota bacterium]MCB0802436.1 efflux RND transporter periplasmic adaptor subunit [Flavobacteriales bacterium]NOG57687.1 efflux RND transporter periplasmic adaptor subunit [Bacteroidota bacterium]
MEKAIESGDINELKSIRAELSSKQHTLATQMDLISNEISKLDTNKKVPLVSALEIKPQTFKHYIEVQASFDTERNVVLYAEYSGKLNKVLVKAGAKVSKGQLLAIIDDGGLSQQLIQAEVQAELSKTTYERQEKLWKKNIGSEMQFLQAKANHEAHQKAVEQIKEQLAKARIVAPFAGVIDEILIEEGNTVSPGASGIMRIVNLDDMFARADIPEVYVATVKKGKKVEVFVPVLADTIAAEISQANNFINPENRTFKIEARVNNKSWSIKPNMNGKLRIADYVADSAMMVPKNVISEDAEGNKYIFIADDIQGKMAIAKKQFITLGVFEGNNYEVLKGLTPGTKIINEGARIVLDGQKVEILN